MTDVDSEIVPPEIPAVIPPVQKPKPRWGRRVGLGFGVLLSIAIVTGFLVHLDYYSFSPGDTVAAEPLVVVQDLTTYPAKGQVRYTTVLQSRDRINLFGWLEAKWDSDIDLIRAKDLLGNKSKAQSDKEDQQAMVTSQTTAASVAMQRLGFKGLGVEILDIMSTAPSSKLLKTGDVITSIDDKPVAYVSDLSPLIVHHKPTDILKIVVTRGGQKLTQQVPLTTVNDSAGNPHVIIGISPQGKFGEKVSVKLQNVGGPSAGLAFTLSVIDVLTPGELTGGKNVATTGTIELDGSVGEIGGIKQKTISVRDSGAVMFIVPASEAAEAQKYAGSKLKIVGVKNLEEALTALGTLGGNVTDLPPFRAAAA